MSLFIQTKDYLNKFEAVKTVFTPLGSPLVSLHADMYLKEKGDGFNFGTEAIITDGSNIARFTTTSSNKAKTEIVADKPYLNFQNGAYVATQSTLDLTKSFTATAITHSSGVGRIFNFGGVTGTTAFTHRFYANIANMSLNVSFGEQVDILKFPLTDGLVSLILQFDAVNKKVIATVNGITKEANVTVPSGVLQNITFSGATNTTSKINVFQLFDGLADLKKAKNYLDFLR